MMADLVEVPLLFIRVRLKVGRKFLEGCSENGRQPRLKNVTYFAVYRRGERLGTRRVFGKGSYVYRKLISISWSNLLPAEHL